MWQPRCSVASRKCFAGFLGAASILAAVLIWKKAADRQEYQYHEPESSLATTAAINLSESVQAYQYYEPESSLATTAAINLSESVLASPCQLPLRSRTPQPWCKSNFTLCHFRSCTACRALCERSHECRSQLEAYNVVSASVTATRQLKVVVSGPVQNSSGTASCSDELVLVVKGPMLTQTYMTEPHGVLVAHGHSNACHYDFDSLPLIPGEYRFIVEARLLRGLAFSAEPNLLKIHQCVVHVAAMKKGPPVTVDMPHVYHEAFGPVTILDQPIAPGIIRFSVQIEKTPLQTHHADCRSWKQRGVWVHWTRVGS